ncbi:MAG: hypothetical protein V1900_04580 [Candidatus Aenigmatarchaeota archaeon]
MEIEVKEIFLDEWVKLHTFISRNYDRKAKKHLVFVTGVSFAGLTDVYKGKRGDVHQVYRGVTLYVRDGIPKKKRDELKSIIGDF